MPHDRPAHHVEVDDPAAAFRKLEDLGRRVLSVPKKVEKETKPTAVKRRPKRRR